MKKYMKLKIVSIFLLAILLLSITPNVFGGDKEKKPKKTKKKDTSMEIVLSYDTPDIDFGTIDYSGIEYFVDGVPYVTDASGIIQHSFNDEEEHIFTLLWHGILSEFIFSESISEGVVLENKVIEINSLWAEVLTHVPDINVEVWYYDGTTWSLIETTTTDSIGVATISGLVMGEFIVCEVGSFDALNNFTLDQLTQLYTAEVLIDAVKTIIDVDHLNTIFGTDYSIDLTDIDWVIEFYTVAAGWRDIANLGVLYLYYDLSDIANGNIVIYNLNDEESYPYKIIIGNAWNIEVDIIPNTITEVDLPAKSLEAEFLWSGDNAPVVGMEIELFWNNGTDFVSMGIYVTDVDGKVIITEMIPIGTYKLNDYAAFDITAMDIIHIEQHIIESTKETVSVLGKGKFYCRYIWENISVFFF